MYTKVLKNMNVINNVLEIYLNFFIIFFFIVLKVEFQNQTKEDLEGELQELSIKRRWQSIKGCSQEQQIVYYVSENRINKSPGLQMKRCPKWKKEENLKK